MSASTVKAERRALRRAVGPELVSFTQETTQAIRLLQRAQENLANDSQEFRRRLGGHEDRLDVLTGHAERSFWQRVRAWRRHWWPYR